MAFDFDSAVGAPFRTQPGMLRVPPGTAQLTPNRAGDRHLRDKLAVLTQWPDSALRQRDGFDPGPALSAAAMQAQQEHPTAWSVDAAGRWCAHWLGWAVGGAGEVAELAAAAAPGSVVPQIGACLRRLPAAWRRAGLLALAFQEDLAIVDAADGSIPWVAVALPSHWAPEDKVGRHFSEVHAPVADNQLLLKASEHLMRLVTGSDRWMRYVWQITPNPQLHHHPHREGARCWPSTGTADEFGAVAWFRTETQTFIPVPGRAQAIFTIQVAIEPLAETARVPARAAVLRDALATMSPGALAYRTLAEARGPLMAWLAERAA